MTSARAGIVLGVSTHPTGTSMWRLGGPLQDAALGPAALASWHDVQLALTRSLPVLWESVSDHRSVPQLSIIEAWAVRGFPQRVSVVDGPSFGLAFALLLTSRVSGIAVPETHLATASVNPSGAVGQVEGLPDKIAAIVDVAPQVTTIVVAAAQESEARSICGDRLEVVGVRNVAEACEIVFGDRLVNKLLQLGADAEGRRRLVASLFRVALKGRGELIDWTPLERAAAVALDQWLEIPADQRWTLEFVRGVAARHQRNGGMIPVPEQIPIDWPRALWLDVLSHLLQQSADSGDPAPNAVVPLAGREIPVKLMDALGPELRVAGALARVEAVTGAPQFALERQADLSAIHWKAYAWHELSRPLAEWLRLAGACGSHDSFEHAENLMREAEPYGAIDANGLAYVRLSWARAAVALGAHRGNEPTRVLDDLAKDATVPDHVRWSAVRWLARHLADSGDVEGQRRMIRSLEDDSSADRLIALLLSRLDDAVRIQAPTANEPHLEHLRRLQPGVVGHLLSAAPQGLQAEYVARYYPY